MTTGTKAIVWAVGVFVAIMIAIIVAPFTIVSAGERAVVLNFGKVDRVLSEGVHWVTPIVENVETMDVRVQAEDVNAAAASKDLQSLNTQVTVNYQLVPENVGILYQTVGKDYKTRVIDPSVQEAVKAATARYTAEESITKRELVKAEIRQLLIEAVNAKANNLITITDVSITNFGFSPAFDQAIEAKVRAEQEALKAKNDLERVKFESQQQVAKAQAEAQSIRMQSEAANNQKYVELKALEVQLEFAKRWNGMYPSTYIVNGSGSNGPLQVIPLPAVK